MIINKVLNNNFVIVKDENGTEKILGGKGIAFGKKPGQFVDSDCVNKVFVVPNSNDNLVALKYIEALPVEYLGIAIEIVEFAKDKTEKKLSESVCLGIANHLNCAVIRHRAGWEIPNYMLWEIKKYYMDEYEVVLYGMALVEEKLGIKFSEEEAGYVAIHLIDSELDGANNEQMHKTRELIQDINTIVERYFKLNINQESIYYQRFTTNLTFFANRLFNGSEFKPEEDNKLYNMLQNDYRDAYNCTIEIGEYLKHNYDYTLSNEEKIYLTIHIENIISKSK